MKTLFIIALLTGSSAFSQLFNSGKLSVTNGGILSVINSSLVNDGIGDLKNAGTIYVDNNIENNGLMDGASVNTGIYKLGKHWVNNGTFNADNSVVDMFGGDQSITGTSITTFYDLWLNGLGVKKQTINANTTFLDLTVNELATTNFIMKILSPDATAISRTTGFVSSLNNGHLKRNTNTTSSYLFPVGTLKPGGLLYRPIDITPTNATNNTFGVRLASNHAGDDGYSFTSKEENINNFNEKFYHHIYNNLNTNNGDVTFYFDPATDGNFTNVAQWKPSGNWKSNFNETKSAVGLFSTITLNNVSNFDKRAFILINKVDEIYIQNAFTPNADNVNDFFSLNFNKEDFQNFTFLVFNRWGELIYESNESSFAWNGEYKGVIVPTGVYPWKLLYKYAGDIKNRIKTGHLTVIK